MFLEFIRIIDTTPCLADRELFKGTARASVNLSEILPYLNSIVEKPNYQVSSNALMFKQGIIGITLREDIVALTRFANMTQAYELLDWLRELINDAYESRSEITPNYKGRKQLGLLQIYSMLPKKNCAKCGEQSCMAFAGKLSKFDADMDDCPLLNEPQYKDLKDKLSDAFLGE